MPSRNRIVIGTRRSRLALAQTQLVADAIRRARSGVRVDLHTVVTQGDIRLDKPLPQIGGKGLFTSELEQALLAGQVDLAVHSAKDLPSDMPPGLDILCVPPRAPVADVLVTRHRVTLHDLPLGAVVGTSSLRRQLQLQAMRPGLRFADIRGNIDTRVGKMLAGQYDAVVLAEAGLLRAGMSEVAYRSLPVEQVLPAPGQAILAIQGRADDATLREMLSPVNDPVTQDCLAAERQLLQELALDCQMPFAALCEPQPGGYRIRTWLADPRTGRSIRTDLHAAAWQQALADTLRRIESAGGREIIEGFGP